MCLQDNRTTNEDEIVGFNAEEVGHQERRFSVGHITEEIGHRLSVVGPPHSLGEHHRHVDDSQLVAHFHVLLLWH